MLPTTSRGRSSSSTSHHRANSNTMFPQYLRRIVKVPVLSKLLGDACLASIDESAHQNYTGNKWILNILSGKCFTCAPHRKLFAALFGAKSKSWQQPKSKVKTWIFIAYGFGSKKCWKSRKQKQKVETEGFPKGAQVFIKNVFEFGIETKNQWARDDPAFVVICSLLLAVATLAYCAAYDHSAVHAVFVVISILLFHFLITGAILASCCWFLTNAYLREETPNSHVVEQRVEWLYTFDVHCNSFFPMFVMLYVIHYFLSPLLVAHGFIPVLLSNLLFMVAASYYHYLNFLGYDVLPFLERTTFFLYPIGAVIVLSPILILSGFNPSRYFMNMYFSQRL